MTSFNGGAPPSGDGDYPTPTATRLVRNTLAVGAGNGWAMLLALALLPVTLRGLGPAAFGAWVLLQTFSAISGWFSLADLGVGPATTRAIATSVAAGDLHRARSNVVTSLLIFAGLGGIAIVLLPAVGRLALPLAFGIPPELRSAFSTAAGFFGLQIGFDLLTEGVESCLEGFQRVDLSRLADAVRRTLVTLAVGSSAIVTGRLDEVALASLVASAIAAGVSIVLIAALMQWRAARPSWQNARGLLGYGGRAAIFNGTGVIHRVMDRTIVGVLLGPAAVTLVEIATQIQNGASAVLSASAYAVTPAASFIHAMNHIEMARKLVLRGTKYAMLVTLPVAVGAMVTAGPLVAVWVGDRYRASADLVVLALVYVLLASPLAVGANYLLGAGQVGKLIRFSAISLGVNLVASVCLVILLGIPGVFLGTIIGMTAQFYPLLRYYLAAVDSSLLEFLTEAVQPLVVPVLAVAVVSAVVVLLPLENHAKLAVAVLSAGVSYALTVRIFAVSPAERAELLSFIRRPKRST